MEITDQVLNIPLDTTYAFIKLGKKWPSAKEKRFKTQKTTVIINLGNRKHSFWVLRVKRVLKSLDPTDLDFPVGTRIFIIESLCVYYCGLWNKCKKLKGMGKLHVFFVSSSTIKAKILEIN